ncbi:hypothetical protein Acr_00g0007550 [Actinidia rufa]|uniref:Uncharacterized protein n=1 Tax=Actinidia rufa TaxID=165716 RepID=A0A7J0DA27_9ERIC|nr:hypothetical protein Acr_00g0007550 [Actinidia rufa]
MAQLINMYQQQGEIYSPPNQIVSWSFRRKSSLCWVDVVDSGAGFSNTGAKGYL